VDLGCDELEQPSRPMKKTNKPFNFKGVLPKIKLQLQNKNLKGIDVFLQEFTAIKLIANCF
jgi:hypothetical protein